MRLIDLNPAFLGAGGEGISNADGTPAARREAVGLDFDCPCGGGGVRIFVGFRNPVDGGPPFDPEPHHTWQRTGESFETLTLMPSILRRDNCGWHGYITSGEIVTL